MKYLVISFLMLLSLVAKPQNPAKQTTSTIEEGGFEYYRLERINNLIQEYVDKKWLIGANALILYNGETVFNKAYGIQKTNPDKKMKNDAIYRIASQTKAITSVAVMILYEEGKFLLDDPISKYIPAFANPKILKTFNEKDSSYTTEPAKKEITIRELLTHTSGIGYAQIGSPSMRAIYEKAGIVAGFSIEKRKLEDMINTLGTLPLEHNPGERFTYSMSIDVLGRLVEVTSGQNLEVFFKERIFEPLRMEDTYFNLPVKKQSRLVQVFTEDSNTGQIIPWTSNPTPGMTVDFPINNNGLYAGGAGLVSTIGDYGKFLQMILKKGESPSGRRILARRTVEMMSQNQIGELSLGPDKFGLGFQITTKNGQAKLGMTKGSLSWGGYFGTSYWADPKENIVCLFFTQQTNNSHGDIADKFKAMVYQALK